MRLDSGACRRLFGSARVARLATVGSSGPHVVPFVFALDGDRIVSAVDHKPKSSRKLKRIDNIRRDDRVSILADRYEEDWTRLWWVRADGVATVQDEPDVIRSVGASLAAKYPQYAHRPPEGPAIVVVVSLWSGWSSTPPGIA